MANYQLLKADIDAKVYENEHREITGENLNAVLNAMVTTLGVGYQFMGIATPSTNPGTPDQNVFYIASEIGTYPNFNGLVVPDGELAILKYNGTWTKDATGIASQAKLSELEQELQKEGSITSAKIADSAVTSAKIDDSAVTSAKIAPNSIGTSKIIDGTIQSTDLNPNAFDNTLTTSGKIAPADVVGSKLTELEQELGVGYQFRGVATPSTNPGTPDAKVFYIANGKGTYANFGGLIVDEDEVIILKYNGTWTKDATGIASQAKFSELEQELGAGYQFMGIATPSTNPGTPDQKVFYIANGKGTYTNFGGINVTEDEVIFLVLDNAWHKAATGIAADAKLKEAVTELTEIAGKINTKQDKLTAGNGITISGNTISSTVSGGTSVTVDSSLSSTSTNPVQNKVVKAALDAKQDKMTIDSALNATSANPIQNKVVKEALDAKQDRMTIDSALNATSANPIQNKVVKEALDKKQDALTAGTGIIINGSEISTAYKIWHGSQAEYDAIAAKDDMTIYLIEES